MSFFGSIVDRIVHYATATLDPSAAAAPAISAKADADAAPTASPAPPPTEAIPPAAATPAAPLQSVDIGAVLGALSAQRGGGLNWQSSIVDLLKLLDLDASLQSRKTLAGELDVHAGADGSAEENIALHKAVMQKIAANGGKVPADMQG